MRIYVYDERKKIRSQILNTSNLKCQGHVQVEMLNRQLKCKSGTQKKGEAEVWVLIGV